MRIQKAPSTSELQFRCEGIKEAFFANLSANEKELFKATTFARQILDEVTVAEKAHQDKSISRKSSKALRPFLDGINQYGEALDVLSNASSLVLCPIWGAARVILRLATEFGEYFEKIARMFQQIGTDLNSLQRFPQLYPNNDRLLSAMVGVYQAIFDFCTRARRVFAQVREDRDRRFRVPIGLQAMIKIPWKPFKAEFGEIQDKLLLNMEEVEKEVRLAELEEAHFERKKAEKERCAQSSRWERTEVVHSKLEEYLDEQSIDRLTRWLSPVDFELNHTAAVKLRHSGTGQWFMQSGVFRTWFRNENSFLWLHAIPGAGKTVLMSSTIEYIKRKHLSKDVGLAYFYCDYKEKQKQDPFKVLSTLLYQLARSNVMLYQRLQSFFQDQRANNSSFAPGLDVLREKFSLFIEGAFSRVILFVDAVDECVHRECIAQALKDLWISCSSVKIMVSSRQDHDIRAIFEELPSLSITQSQVASDIESFVKAEVSNRMKSRKLKIRNPDLQRIICEKLVDRAGGMFQLVKCQIDSLCALGMDKLILKALDDLPRDLVGTYTRILKRIKHDCEQLDHVVRLLQWLVKGTRTMSLDELSECIGIEIGGQDDYMDPGGVVTDPKDILNLCGSLVTVSGDGRVSLAHSTVKEFLISDFIEREMSDFYMGGDKVEASLATSCLTYLNYSDFIEGAVPDTERYKALLNRYHFLAYAAESWAAHAYRCREENADEMILHLLRSEKEGRGNLSLWMQVYESLKANRLIFVPTHPNPVYYATLFGLSRSLQSLLEDGFEYHGHDVERNPLKIAIGHNYDEILNILLNHGTGIDQSELEELLYLAASKGHHEQVLTLLGRGVAVDSRNGTQGTALQVAAQEGHEAVVRVLLRHRASTEVVSPRFGTPLSAAAERGHQTCFQLLINARASICGKGGVYAYPLISALVGRNNAITQVLINKGVDVNLSGGKHTNALVAASVISTVEWVEKLIKAGAKVNDEDEKRANALHTACCANRINIVNVLLAHGADVNAKGNKYRNALDAANSGGSLSIMNVILRHGADTSALDGAYPNVLRAAVLGGHDAAFEDLAPRCDLNATDDSKGSVLVIAASVGNIKLVRRLFELGVTTGLTEDMSNATVAAAAQAHDEVISLLIEKGADVNASGKYKARQWTPLQAAANKGHVRTVNHLLECNANPNIIAGVYGTALMAAADKAGSSACQVRIIEDLLHAGAVVNTRLGICGTGGWDTALSCAIGRNNVEAARLLLANGAEINISHENFATPLQVASNIGNPEMLEMLLQYGADPNISIAPSNAPDDDGIITPLQEAAYFGSENTIQLLLAVGANLIIERNDSRFKSALHAASFAGQLENVRLLIEVGSDVNCGGGFYGTSLQAAAFKGHVEVLKVLLDAGADINVCSVGHYGTAFMAALDHDNDDNLEMVKLLLERGADPSLRASTDFQFPLHAACWHGSDQVVNALIAAGAHVNAFGGKYHSALQAAAAQGQSDIMAVLIDRGADVDAAGGIFGTAFAAAYHCGWYLCTNLLYNHEASNGILAGNLGSPLGAALDGACLTLIIFLIENHDVDPNGYLGRRLGSPLHHCIKARQWIGKENDADKIVELLLKHGADVNGLGPEGFGGHWGTPLNCAVAKGSIDITRRLINAGADIDLCGNRKGWTALQLACLTQNEEAVDLLLEKGADVDSHGSYGTPLTAASYGGSTHIIEKLLVHGARIDTHNKGRYGDALQSAVIRGHERAAKLLIRRGANINTEGGCFGSILQAASMRCSERFIKFLIEKGANVNHCGGRYKTALQAAAASGQRKVVSILLRNGADAKTRGGRYGSALQAACVYGNLRSVRALIDHGADVNVRGGFYGNALSAAAAKGHVKIVQYLAHKAGATALTIDHQSKRLGQAVLDKAKRIVEEALKVGYHDDHEGRDSNIDSDSETDSLSDPDADVAPCESSESTTCNNHSINGALDAGKPPSPEKHTSLTADEQANEVGREFLESLGWLQVEC